MTRRSFVDRIDQTWFAAGVVLLYSAIIAGILIFTGRARSQSYDYLVVNQGALSNTVATVKASPTPLLGYSCYNPNVVATFVQTFDIVGAVTLGTTVPTLSFSIPPLSSTGVVPPVPTTGAPRYYATGLKVAATTTATGGAAPTSALVCDFLIR